MALNGWISVLDKEKPNGGEQVLSLSYTGAMPPPPDPFSYPENRFYNTPHYFYPGDTDFNEVLGDEDAGIPGGVCKTIFETEGFYVYEPDLRDGGACRWRRLATARELQSGILFWKRLDWPKEV